MTQKKQTKFFGSIKEYEEYLRKEEATQAEASKSHAHTEKAGRERGCVRQ